MKPIVIAVLVVALGILGILLYARRSWRAGTDALVRELVAAPAVPDVRYSTERMEDLPPPVQRYFRAVLQEGQLIHRRVRLRQVGEFFLQTGKGRWAPFDAEEYLTASPPGFIWNAKIRMAPGIGVRVRDGLVEGKGMMLGKGLGLFTVVRSEGTAAVTAGALHRYLAEAVWLPTALLPSEGVVWTPIDDSTARAALTAGGVTVSLEFHFGPDSLVHSVFTPAREYTAKDGGTTPMPWRGRWYDYQRRHGMRVPLAGEVEWILPGGRLPYWRGRVTKMDYLPDITD
ncbi:MAG: DUF6544 family protein [Gemmatimonadales bacterium]